MIDMLQLGKDGKAAARELRKFDTDAKNRLLTAIADALEANRDHILAENAKDLADGEQNGMTSALLDRLNLQKRLDGVIADVRNVVNLPDPVGVEFDGRMLTEGLTAIKRRVPLGVLGVIYESRPNVTVDIATLALKTSNAVILRGGSETLRSNIALVDVIQGCVGGGRLPGQVCAAHPGHGSQIRGRTAQALRLRGYDHPARRQPPARILPGE